MSNIKLFQSKQIRSVWNEEEQRWYFSIVDVVGALSDSTNPTDYLKKMRKRDPELATYLGTICPQVTMLTEAGKKRRTLAGNTTQILRIIQSIPSPKSKTLNSRKAAYVKPIAPRVTATNGSSYASSA